MRFYKILVSFSFWPKTYLSANVNIHDSVRASLSLIWFISRNKNGSLLLFSWFLSMPLSQWGSISLKSNFNPVILHYGHTICNFTSPFCLGFNQANLTTNAITPSSTVSLQPPPPMLPLPLPLWGKTEKRRKNETKQNIVDKIP